MDYKLLFSQVESLIDKDAPLVSNLANIAALLNQIEDLNWCGFYLNDKEKFILGPFQGEVACIYIPYSKGVIGYTYQNKKTTIVDDVNKFKGHIACSKKSQSEIVVPIFKDNEIKAVIDLDSPKLNRFSKIDQENLEKIARLIAPLF